MKSIKLFTVLMALTICAVSCEDTSDVWAPNDLNVSSLSSHSAVLGWGGVADEFELKVGDVQTTTTKRSYALKDLTPETEVRWSVRTIKDGTRSEWKEHSFKTLSLPVKPTSLAATPSFRTVELTWSGPERQQYEVKINDTVYVSSKAKYVVDKLDPSTTYSWSVRTKRGDDFSDWATASFTTALRPAAPTNLAVTAAATSATFTWSGSDPAYQLKVGTNTYNVNGNTHTVNNLTGGTQYSWGVRVNAGDDVYSDWAESTFTTKIVLTAPITVNSINVMTANVTVTPGSGATEYYVLLASKELYQDFVDAYTDGDEVSFVELLGEPYETGEPSTATWELNGSTGYDYYIAILLYDGEGNPSVVKHVITSPAFQKGLPEASATITVSDITATSAKIVTAPDANALGFYSGLFIKDDYDETVASDGEEYIRNYLAIYGDLYMAPAVDDYTWKTLTPNTEYIMVAAPFNANGIEGYGELVTKTFKTLEASAAAAVRHKAANAHKVITKQTNHKKAITAETIKLLNLKKK